MNKSKNKKTIRLRDEVPADFDTQRLERENTRALMQALHGCRKNCRECREEEKEYYPETKIEQKGVKHA